MKSSLRFLFLFALVAGLVTATGWVPARSDTPAASDLVRVVVTAHGRPGNPAPVVMGDDLLVYQDSQRRPVVDWQPAAAEGARLDLVLFLDDALDTRVGLQLDDLAAFIRSLPATTRVAVAYGRNGTATLVQDFTSDHELAAAALRLPLGTQGASSSPYLSLIDLLGRLPQDGHRREVLMVSDGVDLFRGLEDSSPASNTDLRRAIERAQRRGVVVDTIYARGESPLHRNFILVTNGQSSLARLAFETGGQAFFQGFDTAVAFQPFLGELAANLGQQYVLTFRALPGRKAGYQRFQITTEVPGVDLVAPAQLYIPAAK